jgi:hypothetical protein
VPASRRQADSAHPIRTQRRRQWGERWQRPSSSTTWNAHCARSQPGRAPLASAIAARIGSRTGLSAVRLAIFMWWRLCALRWRTHMPAPPALSLHLAKFPSLGDITSWVLAGASIRLPSSVGRGGAQGPTKASPGALLYAAYAFWITDPSAKLLVSVRGGCGRGCIWERTFWRSPM